MSLRERLARIISHEVKGAESLWKSHLRVVDMLLYDVAAASAQETMDAAVESRPTWEKMGKVAKE